MLTRWIAALALGAGGLVVAGTSTAHAGGPVRYQAEEARLVHATARDDRAGFDGTGFADYDRAAGGYVEFTVTAPTAGWAMLRIRYANGSRHERYLSVGINGEVHPTPVAFSPTGSWNTWQEYPVTPLLSAGVNKIRLIADGSGGGPNLDWMEVEITAETVDYQAEDAAISGGVVQSEHAGFTGRGYVNTTNAVGASVTWTVDAAVRDSVGIFWRFANGSMQDRTTVLTVNGTVVTNEWLFRGRGLGAWTRWDIAGLSVWLEAGRNTITLTATTPDGAPNLDKLIVIVPG
ncbi:MAG TPA: CBM35 domain-containing protein [Micromonosporaceae bacterium]|nr:CBM35 domain-containing protein [Micromonosporaceae bacterium]